MKKKKRLTCQFVLIGLLGFLGQLLGGLLLPHQRIIRLPLRLCFRRFHFLFDFVLQNMKKRRKEIRKVSSQGSLIQLQKGSILVAHTHARDLLFYLSRSGLE